MQRLLALTLFIGGLLLGGHAVAAPADQYRLYVTAPGQAKQGEDLDLVVRVDAATAVSAVKVAIPVPQGFSYESADMTGSVFTTEVSAPAVKDGELTFARLRADTGYVGQGGLVAHLIFKATKSGSLTIGPAKQGSQLIAFSDSSDVLADTAGATIAVQRPPYAWVSWVVGLLLVFSLVAVSLFSLRRRAA